jgi:DNA mismatch endonuclease, patch repair protein
MAAIRSKNTKPEILIRRGLHARGFRFRLNHQALPGKPDLVLAKYRAVIFVNGCFWHGHDCPMFRWPATREAFWQKKIAGNVARDATSLAQLQEAGWRTAVVWECAVRGRHRLPQDEVIDSLSVWLSSEGRFLDLRSRNRDEERGQV